jgi:hypothetical protein
MQISSLPTDNLYKFIALFGLVLTVTSLVFLDFSFDRFTTEQLKIELVQEKSKQAHLKADQAFREANASKGGKSQSEKLWQEFKDRSFEAIDTSSNAMGMIRGQNLLGQQALLRLDVLTVLSFVGLVCIVLGFNLWYWKLQRFIDLEIKRKSAEALVDSDSTSATRRTATPRSLRSRA